MDFSLSTSYFAGRRLAPAEMAAQARSLGFAQVELGYFTRETEHDAWQAALHAEGLTVASIHAFCPMPISMPQLGPEVFSLADPDEMGREAAIKAILRSLAWAESFQARAVVTHGGRVELRESRLLFGSRAYRSQLSMAFRATGGYPDHALADRERQMREMAAPQWIDALSFSLDRVLPAFEAAGVTLAFENLPGLEAFPDPAETALLRRRFPTPALGAWYDIGHGELKARVGDWPVEETLALTADFTVGTHIHDVRGLLEDHCAPGEGAVNYEVLLPLLRMPQLIRVFEPSPQVEPEALRAGLALMDNLIGSEG